MPECLKCHSFSTQIEKQKKVYLWYICEKCGFRFTLEAIALAKRIIGIRIVLGLTQAELAYHLGVSTTRISAWENWLTSLPMKKTMKKIVAMERHMEETGTVPGINKMRRSIGLKIYDNRTSPGNKTKILQGNV